VRSRTIPNGISSAAYSDGPTLFDWLDGLKGDPSSRARYPVSPSQEQESEKEQQTNATSGPRCCASSASLDLQRSLESKCRERLRWAGSTMFSLTWKRKATPAGRSYYQLVASGRPTSGNGCGSWQTPSVEEAGRQGSEAAYMEYVENGRTTQCRLRNQVYMASWQSPAVHDAKGTDYQRYTERGIGEGRSCALQDQAQLASWPTPNAGPQNDTDSNWEARREACKATHDNGNGFGMTVGMAAQLTASGETPTGSPAETEKRGQLNPALPRWLQGYPEAWDVAAILAYRLTRTKPQKRESDDSGDTATR
jgi:hypothetical protein